MSDKVIYTVGGTVQAGGGVYISRDADEELLRLCRAGEFCYVLTARQMGKSSLMVATMERLAAEGIRCVEIDLTQMGTELSGMTAEQWYLGLIDLIVDQLDLDLYYVAWWDERAHLGPTQRLSQFLRQVVLEHVAEPVVIFIDEIDSTLNFDFTDDFFAAIRACYNARASDSAFKRLSFVLLGVATPSDLISDPQRTPFNIGRRIDLTDFTHREALPLADGLGLPPVEAGQLLTWILHWTGGHPYLTQHLCAAASSSTAKWDVAAVDRLVEKTFFGEQSVQDSNLQFVRDMLTKRPPNKAAVLKTYRRVHAGQTVLDEERSPVKTGLKLSGIVKREGSNLVVRNRIYEQVFNQEWISQSMPRDWARRIAVISTIFVVLLGGLFGFYVYRQGQQTTEARAQAFIDTFRGSTSADVRITSLAGLFELSGYEDLARQLFYEALSSEEQRALFEKADPQGVGTQLVTVVKGLYTEAEDNDRDNQLLKAMVQPLRESDDPMAVNVVTEIGQWLTAREQYAAGEYEAALWAYDVAITLNDHNPGTYFGRALAYAALGEASQALADFETVLTLDEGWQVRVRQAVESDTQLYAALWRDREVYLSLVGIVLTPTRTPTATPKPPVVAFTVHPETVTVGECAELRWDVVDVQAVYLDGRGVVGRAVKQVCPEQTQTYGLLVVTAAGEFHFGVTLNVVQPSPTAVPTDTPMPTLTWTPTNTPRLPTPTQRPTATETGTLSCRIPSLGEFTPLWEKKRDDLGCPVDHGKVVSPACEQAFEGGHLFWRSDTAQIYVVYDGDKKTGEELFSGVWFVGPREWGWDGSDPNGIGLKPPPDRYEPIGGLGWVWREYLGGSEGRLGWATEKEYCFDEQAKAQLYENGLIYKSSGSKAYALLDDDRFIAVRISVSVSQRLRING